MDLHDTPYPEIFPGFFCRLNPVLNFFSQKYTLSQKILHINHKMDIFIRTTEKKGEKNNEK